MGKIIVIANSKGGSAKTTAAIILACAFIRQAIAIALIDCDPNKHYINWAMLVGVFDNLIVSSQEKIISDIRRAKDSSSIVIVDLEGSTNMTMAYAICKADLVIIPCQPSSLDAEEVIKVNTVIEDSMEVSDRYIKRAVLFTKTSEAIVTKLEKKLIKKFSDIGLDIFKTRLSERQAFKNIIDQGCLLQNLPAESSRERVAKNKAVDIANAFAEEVLEKILNTEKSNEQRKHSREETESI